MFFLVVLNIASGGLVPQAAECSTLSMGKANHCRIPEYQGEQGKKRQGQVAIAKGLGDNSRL